MLLYLIIAGGASVGLEIAFSTRHAASDWHGRYG